MEPLPKKINDLADEGLMICMKNSPRTKLLHEHMHDKIRDEKLKQRFDVLESDVKEAVLSQLGLTDV